MLQDQWWTAGARRRVGHAPELRREQRADGLLEASPTSLTTAFTADPELSTASHRRLLTDRLSPNRPKKF
ncbi:unnamed protein product, partial [Brenthis ino]